MITLEGWFDIMSNLRDAGHSWVAILFSIVLVIVNSFFLLKIVLAFLAESIDETDNNDSEMLKNKSIVDSLLAARKWRDRYFGDDISGIERGTIDFLT